MQDADKDIEIRCGECEAEPAETGYDVSRLDYLDRFIQDLIREGRIWSGSYCLRKNGKIIADRAMGTLACGWCGNTCFQPDTLFEIQSVGKVFTAIAILKLTEERKLTLDQPVKKWIPEFDTGEFRNITITHLLTHTSGICALEGVLPQDERSWWEHMDEKDPAGTWLKAVVETGLHAHPGEKWIYSIVSYFILGEIISRASGIYAEEYIKEKIFRPCEMADTHWRKDATKEQLARYNVANETDLEMVRRCKEHGIGQMAAATYPTWEGIPETAGGQMSTCREMLHLGEMILRDGMFRGRRVIGKEALSMLWTPLTGPEVRNVSFGHDEPILYGAGVPIYSAGYDKEQELSEGTIYHEGAGTSVFLADRKADMTAMFQTSFRHEFDWDARAVKGIATILHSGIL